jgi:hypothetical protein
MRNKKRNINIKLLQQEIKHLSVKNEELKGDEKGGKLIELVVDVPLDTKPKKKGIPKNELINTRRLLTM